MKKTKKMFFFMLLVFLMSNTSTMPMFASPMNTASAGHCIMDPITMQCMDTSITISGHIYDSVHTSMTLWSMRVELIANGRIVSTDNAGDNGHYSVRIDRALYPGVTTITLHAYCTMSGEDIEEGFVNLPLGTSPITYNFYLDNATSFF